MAHIIWFLCFVNIHMIEVTNTNQRISHVIVVKYIVICKQLSVLWSVTSRPHYRYRYVCNVFSPVRKAESPTQVQILHFVCSQKEFFVTWRWCNKSNHSSRAWHDWRHSSLGIYEFRSSRGKDTSTLGWHSHSRFVEFIYSRPKTDGICDISKD